MTTVTLSPGGGAAQTFIVPVGITNLSVMARGACGNGTLGTSGNIHAGNGGRGAVWEGDIPVTPGETLTIQVGQTGGTGGPYPDGGLAGAANGINSVGGLAGGGSTRIWRSGVGGTLLLICGGGGGGQRGTGTGVPVLTGTADAGVPGAGENGSGITVVGVGTANPGGGASLVAGGAAGSPGTTVAPQAGGFMDGGNGGSLTQSSNAQHITGGSGGGGGYYGGGGGGVVCATGLSAQNAGGAEGGGGSSLATAFVDTDSWSLSEYQVQGLVEITYGEETDTQPGWYLGLVFGIRNAAPTPPVLMYEWDFRSLGGLPAGWSVVSGTPEYLAAGVKSVGSGDFHIRTDDPYTLPTSFTILSAGFNIPILSGTGASVHYLSPDLTAIKGHQARATAGGGDMVDHFSLPLDIDVGIPFTTPTATRWWATVLTTTTLTSYCYDSNESGTFSSPITIAGMPSGRLSVIGTNGCGMSEVRAYEGALTTAEILTVLMAMGL